MAMRVPRRIASSQIVGNKNGGFGELLGECFELILQLPPDQGIEGGKGFVHQEHIGIGRQRTRQPHTLLHAAREFVGKTIFKSL